MPAALPLAPTRVALPPHAMRCPQCALEVALPTLNEGSRASCPRCGEVLCAISQRVIDATLAYALTALLFLLLSLRFPLLGISVEGIHQQMTLFGSAEALLREDFTLLADIMVLAVLLIPALFLLCTLYVYASLRQGRYRPGTRSLAQVALSCRPWMMVDVFVLATMVSLIKLSSLADVSLGKAFWSLLLFSVALTKTVSLIDSHWLRYRLALLSGHLPAADSTPFHCCPRCGTPTPAHAGRCTACHARQHPRPPYNRQLTLALLCTAILLYLPANLYPIMLTQYLGKTQPSTILEGVLLLWRLGSYPVASIIFIASVLVPIAKFCALLLLLLATHRRTQDPRRYTQLYRITEFIGRWSMVDVFVVSIMVALVQMGQLMSIYPGVAALSFAGMVIFTMLAAMCFDVRLVWDAQTKEKKPHD